jgi:hypothetical protein
LVHACAMLDVAFGMGAVDLFCITDDRFASKGGSPYRAVPVINTKKLFECLKLVRSLHTDHALVAVATNGVIQVDTMGVEVLERVELLDQGDDDDEDDDGSTMKLVLPTGVSYEDGMLELTVNVESEDTRTTKPKSKYEQANVALAMVGPGVKTTKGYFFSFSVKCADSNRDVDGILSGFINRAPGSHGGSNSLKRKCVPME